MALKTSTMLELGSKAPEFTLQDPLGEGFVFSEIRKESPCVVIFMCNHCPFVKKILPRLSEVARDFQGRGVKFVGINSNDPLRHTEDSAERMVELKEAHGLCFPYLIDETQEIAKRFRAACTPDIFLFDSQGELVYRGQFDDSAPKTEIPVTGHSLTSAIECVLSGQEVPTCQKQSIGCSIKWNPGNEPHYYATGSVR